jgi:uncharacterized protein YuzE
MNWTFDISSQAIYFALTAGAPARQEELDSGALVLDVGEDGTVIGIEVLGPLSEAGCRCLCSHPGLSTEVAMCVIGTVGMLEAGEIGSPPVRLDADPKLDEQENSPVDLNELVSA